MDILNNAKPYIMYFATYYLLGIQLILIFLAFLAHELSERYLYAQLEMLVKR